MQAGRPAQPSAADSPSSSHPRKGFCEASRAFRFLRCTAARVAPEGVPGQAHIHEPRGSAPRERDHRGGDHPVPSRTRQLSPPSPRVLQREAAGGQGVALAEGAFLYAPIGRRPPTGRRPPRPGRARGAARATPLVGRRGAARRHRKSSCVVAAQRIELGSARVVACALQEASGLRRFSCESSLWLGGVRDAVISCWRLPWCFARNCGLSCDSVYIDSFLRYAAFGFSSCSCCLLRCMRSV